MVLLAALAGLAVVPYPSSPASASCVAPWLSFDGEYPAADARVPLVRGEEVTVVGRGFREGCNDTGSSSGVFGCSGEDMGEEETPLQDVELFLVQQRPTLLQVSVGVEDAGTADEGRLGWVTWTFTVPETMRLGGARFSSEGAENLEVRIVE
jgi:hypothetical protein